MPDIVLIAPGSPDPRHAEAVDHLTDAVRDRTRRGRAVGACFLAHAAPSAVELGPELGRSAIAVPLLLLPEPGAAEAYSEALRDLGSAGSDVRLTPALGPDPRLLRACEELLLSAGVEADGGTAVVVYLPAADPGAGGNLLADPPPGWGAWALATLRGGEHLDDVVARLRAEAERVVAVAFVVTPGADRDAMAHRCADLDVPLAPGTLADTALLADVVIARTSVG